MLRFQWVLPDDIPPQARHVPAFDWSNDALARATVIAQGSASIATQWTNGPLAVEDMAKTLRMRLIYSGMAAPSGRLKAETIGRDLAAFLSKFAEWPEAPALCVGSDAALTVLRRVIQAGGKPMHPLRYIVAATWLFGSWEEFATACRSQCAHPPRAKAAASPTNGSGLHDSVRAAFLENLDAGSGAVTTVARTMGIDAETGLVWAEQAGRIIQRRPKICDGQTRAGIARDLALGQPKMTIAERHRVSVVTITRVLLSIPGLKDRRDQRLREVRGTQAHLKICKCLSRFPNIGAKELRERCPADFAWLYRHDRPWLQSQTQGLRRAKQAPASRVDWNARDHEFAHVIASLQQVPGDASHAPKQPRPGDVVRAVPGLRQKVRHLSRMPLTSKAIAAATGAKVRKG